ncbi:uncharacterized protein LOC112175774 isoform X2 [Rosa chinensis]|uniref:uncharacterized protein LOC112175774 isoform X2 n=1 Tax=Rosa chinensis TaxID=74649 RepID=UPI001AD93403|nr:uncharacterized protein LOC112175774 isoform X2 [Rosa chinensis]
MGGPCDICGGYTDRGNAFENLIVTCCKCRIAREHLYCMRAKISYCNWDKWACESCTKEEGTLCSKSSIKGDPVPLSADIADYDGRHFASPSKNSGWQAHSSRQKAVKSGKVRYITHEEVQQLANTKSTSPQKTSIVVKTVASKPPLSRVNAPPDVTWPKHSRPPNRQSISISEKGSPFSISQTVTRPRRGRPPKKQSISISEKGSPFSSSQTVMRPRCGRPRKMLSISKINHQASQIIKHSQENWSPGTHTKGHVIKEKPMDGSVLSRGAETSSRKIMKEPNTLSCTPSPSPSPSRHSSLNMSSGGETSAAEHNHTDGEERNLLNIFSSLHLYHASLPALHATWKGGFFIFDADTPAQFIGGFQAQLPCKVRRRAYDLSQKMPAVLRATLLPRLHLWDDPFQNECPELKDVALYFFPDDNIASSRETYASLFEVMDTKSSVLRIYFDGVDAAELLIYTSKQLRLDLLDTVTCPKTQNFLWGIFRSGSNCQADIDDSATIADMEVDMVGGKMVGSVDVVVSKDSSTPCRMSEQPRMTAVQQLLCITKQEHSSYQNRMRLLDTAIKQLLGVKSEEPKDSDTSASSAMETTIALQQAMLEKDNDEMVGTSSTTDHADNQS